MPSTVSGIIDVIRLNVDHSSLTDTQALNLINNGMRRLQRETPYTFEEAKATGSISTVSTTLQTWTFPTDMKAPLRFYQVISGEHWPVHYKDYFVGIEEFTGSTDADTLAYYSFYGTSGYLFPRLSSAATYEFYYSKIIPDFTGATASNTILETIPEALEYVGTAEYYDYLSETKRTTSWREKAADAVKSLIKQTQWRRESAQTAVPTTYGTIGRQR